jgi:DNA-binding transcriptional regulator GbsR (MarR family)
MLLSDLEDWNIILIHKKIKPKTYIANEKLIQMIVHVFQKREKGLLQHTRSQLQEAYNEALLDDAPQPVLHRIQLMIKLSKLIDRLLGMLSALSPLNINTLLEKFFTPS